MTNSNAERPPDSILPDKEIAPFVGLPDAEERLRDYLDNRFRAEHPFPWSPEAEQAAIETFNYARERLRRLTTQETGTDSYSVSRERDPDAQMNWIEWGFGLWALCALTLAMLTVPGLATMLIVETGKISLVADWPIFGLAFGITALAGILAAVGYRDHLSSDEERLRFDRLLSKATVCVFLLWATTASLAAFPPTLGGAESQAATDWATGSAASSSDQPIQIAPPMWLLFLVTALLDLVAAPTLHGFVLGRVTPRPIRRPIMNGEHDLLHNELIVKARVELDVAADTLKALRDGKDRWGAALEAHIASGLARLRQLNASIEAVRNAAGDAALREVLKKPPQPDEPEDP